MRTQSLRTQSQNGKEGSELRFSDSTHSAHFTALRFPYLGEQTFQATLIKFDLYLVYCRKEVDFTHQPFPKSNAFQVENQYMGFLKVRTP